MSNGEDCIIVLTGSLEEDTVSFFGFLFQEVNYEIQRLVCTERPTENELSKVSRKYGL